jgi:hypothetical protein
MWPVSTASISAYHADLALTSPKNARVSVMGSGQLSQVMKSVSRSVILSPLSTITKQCLLIPLVLLETPRSMRRSKRRSKHNLLLCMQPRGSGTMVLSSRRRHAMSLVLASPLPPARPQGVRLGRRARRGMEKAGASGSTECSHTGT